MVIGNGMIAKRFASYTTDNRFVIFASGVSNSKSRDYEAFEREVALLKETIRTHNDKILVYFSTCSLYDPAQQGSQYVRHKKNIEGIIRENQQHYQIFRVSNVVGRSDNPNTIMNFFFYHILNGVNFDLWINSTRNLIDIDDLFKLAGTILQKRLYPNQTINIANPVSYHVEDIVLAIEQFLGIKANYTSIQKGDVFTIEVPEVLALIKELHIEFRADYLTFLLNKYYSDK